MEALEIDLLLFDERLVVMLPESYQKMQKERIALMYPYEDRPQIILEDKKTARFCTFSLLKEQRLAGSQVEFVIHSVMKIVVSLYPSCLLSETDLLKREKGNCGWFSFSTSGTVGMIHNVMYIFSVDGYMMLGTMGCPIEDELGKEELIKIMKLLKVPEKTSEKIPVYARTNMAQIYRAK